MKVLRSCLEDIHRFACFFFFVRCYVSSCFAVSSEISDEKTGSYGEVNIIVPRPSR